MHLHYEHLATTITTHDQRAAEHRRAAREGRPDAGVVARLDRLVERLRGPQPETRSRQPRPASTGPAPVL
jgi:hypothetical protein